MFSLFKKKKPATPKKPSRAEIIRQAQANARKAKEAIGEETLAKIRAHMEQEGNSEFQRALRRIKAMDQERIADNIRATYRDED